MSRIPAKPKTSAADPPARSPALMQLPALLLGGLLASCLAVVSPDIRRPPGAPREVRVEADTTSLRVYWKRPHDDGGMRITKYMAITDGFMNPACETHGSDTGCVITGLSATHGYRVVVHAVNGRGTGAPSDTTLPVTPLMRLPGPAGAVTARGGFGSARIAWVTSQVFTGGAEHHVAWVTGDTTRRCEAPSEVSSCTISGLLNDSLYAFTVEVRNAAGSSAGVTSNAVRPSRYADWKAADLPRIGAVGTLQGVTWTGLRYLAVGATGALHASIEGTTWSTVSVPTQAWLRGIASDGGSMAVAVGAGVILGSNDGGQTWTTRSSPGVSGGTTMRSVIWSPDHAGPGVGRFLAVGGGVSNGVAVSSPSGQSWTQLASGLAEPQSIRLCNAANPGLRNYIMTSTFGRIFTSIDAATWTERVTGVTATLYASAWGPAAGTGSNGAHVVVGGQGVILRSVDGGVTWTRAQPIAGVTAQNDIRAVEWIEDRFVAVGTSGLVLTSWNGLDWDRYEVGDFNSLTGITYGNGRVVVTGANAIRVYRMP